jgi:hypothetical protein
MMNQSQSSAFPDHKFDFGDCVFLSAISEGGTIEGIWHCDQIWHYRVYGLTKFSAAWWQEEKLEHACPDCISSWDQTADCSQCGFSPEDLT